MSMAALECQPEDSTILRVRELRLENFELKRNFGIFQLLSKFWEPKKLRT